MAGTENINRDYSVGTPRLHHSLYIEDGNLVIQVENAVFKVHRYFLSRYSSVLCDMLKSPHTGIGDGTDEKPLVLTGDKASSWEVFLEGIYNNQFMVGSSDPSRENMMLVLPIAHKYCMESTEKAILDKLKQASTTATYVDLMVASRIVGSESLYNQGKQGLLSSDPKPTLEQAKLIGMDAYHEIMTAALFNANRTISSLNAALTRSNASPVMPHGYIDDEIAQSSYMGRAYGRRM